MEKNTLQDFPKDEKLGLVLEGGGVKGAYQFGALKALFEAGYNFDGVTGTSIGALNGALIVQGGYENLIEFWSDIRASKLFEIEDEVVEKALKLDFDIEWVGKLAHIFRNIKNVINNSSDKMYAYFSSFYNEEKIRESKMDYGLVTFSLSDFKPVEVFKEEIPQGQLVDFLVASACFPIYRFQKINGEKYIDGGVYDNMPINLLAKKGYKNIIAIRTKGKEPRRKLLYNNLKIVYITPSEDLGKAVCFTEGRIERNKKLGYFDALRMLNGYMGTKYYILPYNEKMVMSYLHSIPTDALAELVDELIGVRPRQKSDCLREIFYTIKKELKLKTSEQEVVYMTLFELFGALCKMEKFKFYQPLDFMAQVSTRASLKGNTLEEFLDNTKALRNVKLREIFYVFAHYLK
ncbi:MAG TPA: patatin-like phospholipase family protein [Clostridia bacterium]|nr:patatin-like phospholipase family protein [Clostridia bacterium]